MRRDIKKSVAGIMKRWVLKRIFIIGLLLTIVVIGWFLSLFWSAGQFKIIEPHYAGKCAKIPDIIGAEDITIHPITGMAYISACDRRAVSDGHPGKGGIYGYDLNATTPEPVNLTPGAGEDFQPHGISLYVGKDGHDVIFVINHEGGKDRIEIYDLVDGGLSLRKTVSGPMVVSPNDLVAVGPNRFYFSNDHRYVSGLMRMLEDYLKLRLSNVVFFDGARFVEAVSGIGYANGINVSRDGKKVYLCGTTEQSLHIYGRDPGTGELALREKIKLGTGVDNIEVDSAGGLWIGAHPQLLTFVRHARDRAKISPSQVLYLSAKAEGGYDIKEVYLNAGGEVSGSSVAAVGNSRMLIGAVFDRGFLDCRE